ncbi:MAG TPA: helix-turn-helix domain-containing protein [Niabella sp.]|uniref:helix-turn-helix domain-containing protein n=1 Tax=Agriterribacter sp. TaxID=2821509 RepID=UPI002B77CEAD|nr:DUF6597 domain-containing transcriptional factor [Agriterribacter sp.]HRO86388.1 helix-turn-helix domain-containing protein [Niabella sp.]HRP55617.1 helix-turn-helix domain-containing protein [Agriterribacter sp.]
MILRDFLPDPSLREFVQWYRIVHFEFDKANEVLFKAYPPKPEQCLHFFLRGNLEIKWIAGNKKELQLPITLLGQQTYVTSRYNSKDLLNFQIVFQSAAVFRLTGIPAFELTNKNLNAEDVFPKNIRFIFEELQQAKTYRELLTVADRFVVSLASKTRKDAHQLDSVTNLMMKSDDTISFDWLAREPCLCTKQFKRKFYERVGVNPKTYARITRFIKAFNTKNANPDWDWLKIAIERNYFDYQHLVKDYKSFTGLTPNEFHLLESTSPECKLGLAEELYRDRFRLASLPF